MSTHSSGSQRSRAILSLSQSGYNSQNHRHRGHDGKRDLRHPAEAVHFPIAPSFFPVSCTSHHDPSINGDPNLVALRRDKPGRAPISWVDSDRKAECEWIDVLKPLPMLPGIRGSEDTVVMLDPVQQWITCTIRKAMWVLYDWLALMLRGHVLGNRASCATFPRAPTVLRTPYTAARDAHRNGIFLIGINENGVDSRIVLASAEPMIPLFHFP